MALIAVHSDAWLMALAIWYGARLDNGERVQMFKKLNPAGAPTLYRQVVNYPHPPSVTDEPPNKRKKQLPPTEAEKQAKMKGDSYAKAEYQRAQVAPKESYYGRRIEGTNTYEEFYEKVSSIPLRLDPHLHPEAALPHRLTFTARKNFSHNFRQQED